MLFKKTCRVYQCWGAPAHRGQWWRTIAIIRAYRAYTLNIQIDAMTMRVDLKVNKLSLMPNLCRPVNNGGSRNYLNACNCERYNLRLPANVIVSPDTSTCSAITLYRLQLTQATPIQTIDCAIKHCF